MCVLTPTITEKYVREHLLPPCTAGGGVLFVRFCLTPLHSGIVWRASGWWEPGWVRDSPASDPAPAPFLVPVGPAHFAQEDAVSLSTVQWRSLPSASQGPFKPPPSSHESILRAPLAAHPSDPSPLAPPAKPVPIPSEVWATSISFPCDDLQTGSLLRCCSVG